MHLKKKIIDDELKKLILKPLYEKREEEKRKNLINLLKKTLIYNYNNCKKYKNICEYFNFNPKKPFNLDEIPYLTSYVFKNNILSSISKSKIFRQINSSSTTSDKFSRITLDKENNFRWSLSLKRMFLNRVGDKKFSILFLDTDENLKSSSIVSARSSMLKSFLFLGNNYKCCFTNKDNNLELNLAVVLNFFKRIANNENVMIFGFTYILYKYFLKILEQKKIRFKAKNLILVHAGGWKKLEKEKVSRKQLNKLAKKIMNVSERNIIDIYGFTEQGGLLYPTCEKGNRHTTNYSTLLIRNENFEIVKDIKKIGFLQFITPIQLSYPGNSFLTEDIGRIEGIDNCGCGRLGIYFKVIGRYKYETEVRGCGDIMALNFNG